MRTIILVIFAVCMTGTWMGCKNTTQVVEVTENKCPECIGFKYEYPQSLEFIKKYGQPKTLKGTNNDTWIVRFPKGDFTVWMNKKEMKIYKIK